MTEQTLAKRMKTPQERHILADCLFGENYIKNGRLYLQRQPQLPNHILARIMDELGKDDCQLVELFTQKVAELAGLRPLKAKEVCLDLVKALNNAGIEKLTYDIPSEDSVKERLERARGLPNCMLTNMLYSGLTCIVYSSSNRKLFTIGFPEEMASEELVVSTKIRVIEGIPTKRILEEYKANLSTLCKTEATYLEECKSYLGARREKLRQQYVSLTGQAL